MRYFNVDYLCFIRRHNQITAQHIQLCLFDNVVAFLALFLLYKYFD